MAWISLPCYEGFDVMAIWPCKDSVSIYIMNDYLYVRSIWNFYIKVLSCYGLLSTSMINTPVPTGMNILVPFYHGVRYAAYQPRNSDEVRLFFISRCNIRQYSLSGTNSYYVQREAINALLP